MNVVGRHTNGIPASAGETLPGLAAGAVAVSEWKPKKVANWVNQTLGSSLGKDWKSKSSKPAPTFDDT